MKHPNKWRNDAPELPAERIVFLQSTANIVPDIDRRVINRLHAFVCHIAE